MKAIGRFAIALTLTALTAPAILRAQSGPNPNQPYISSISYGGSGCPQGTVGLSLSNNRTVYTLIFDTYVASSGPGVPVTESRKACQLNINVHVPAGTGQYCATTTYRGYVQLPAGGSAEQSASYDGGGDYELPDGQVITIGSNRASTFPGPAAKDYTLTDPFTGSWDRADAGVIALNIKSAIALQGSGQAQATTDSIDGKIVPGACDQDTTGPDISISSPITNGLYGLGAVVAPVFSCSDSQSGVASCTGAPALDTSSIGPKTFTVTAVDQAGNTSTASVSYAVGGKDDCKISGYQKFVVPAFKNQGQCVSTYASGKK